MKWNDGISLRVAARQSVAVGLAFLMLPFAQMQLGAQDGYYPLGAEQLNQLVAPIALYPDALVAQVLTAATYPQQITDANNYVRQNSGIPPEQLAYYVDGLPWDPSVKALTAFPSVLDNLARNYGWTAALGNAYYNQPGDVMNAIQAMRFQAQRAGSLRSSSQLRVYYNGPQIEILPVNPEYVYVPYYDPWRVYGVPLQAYEGYDYYAPPSRGLVYAGLIGFAAVAIGLGVWGHYEWGYHSWSPNWRGGNVYYNQNTYISNSTTVYNRGNFGSFDRGVYEHQGAGVPSNFRPVAPFRGNAVQGNRPEVFTRPGSDPVRPAQGQYDRNNPNSNRPATETRPYLGRPQMQQQTQPQQARPDYRTPGQTDQSGRPQIQQQQARPDYRAPARTDQQPQVQQQPQVRPEYRAPARTDQQPQVQQQQHARPEYRAPMPRTEQPVRPQIQEQQQQARPEYRAPTPRPEQQQQARPEYRAPAPRPEQQQQARPEYRAPAPRPEQQQPAAPQQTRPPAADRRAAPARDPNEKKQ